MREAHVLMNVKAVENIVQQGLQVVAQHQLDTKQQDVIHQIIDVQDNPLVVEESIVQQEQEYVLI